MGILEAINPFKRVSDALSGPLPKKDAPFDPEGTGYDYETARKWGLRPDASGHWPSRVPQTGMLLKGRKHKTWPLTEQGEAKAGFGIEFRDGRYYSVPKQQDQMQLMIDALKFWKPIK